mmetsp:Transcript_6057/g.20171  ORF Transcript_6057/g.20171 Transcript_6057/m.20171 type:complete len:246 (-) Transcript_6057:963-1700(-)
MQPHVRRRRRPRGAGYAFPPARAASRRGRDVFLRAASLRGVGGGFDIDVGAVRQRNRGLRLRAGKFRQLVEVVVRRTVRRTRGSNRERPALRRPKRTTHRRAARFDTPTPYRRRVRVHAVGLVRLQTRRRQILQRFARFLREPRVPQPPLPRRSGKVDHLTQRDRRLRAGHPSLRGGLLRHEHIPEQNSAAQTSAHKHQRADPRRGVPAPPAGGRRRVLRAPRGPRVRDGPPCVLPCRRVQHGQG